MRAAGLGGGKLEKLLDDVVLANGAEDVVLVALGLRNTSRGWAVRFALLTPLRLQEHEARSTPVGPAPILAK